MTKNKCFLIAPGWVAQIEEAILKPENVLEERRKIK